MSDTPAEGAAGAEYPSLAEQDRERRYAAYLDYIPPRASFMAFVLTDAIQWHAWLSMNADLPEVRAHSERVMEMLTDLYTRAASGEGDTEFAKTIRLASGSEQFAHEAQDAIERAVLFGQATQVESAGKQAAVVLPGSGREAPDGR